jgi:antitoxin FitA
MRQLITRLDDDLHEGLRRRAEREGRSVNAVVVEALARLIETPPDARARVRGRMRRLGLLSVPPPPPSPPPSLDEAIESTRGAGDAVLEALEGDRSAR